MPSPDDSLPRYFVYTWSARGPSPEKWHGDLTRGTGGFRYKPVGADGSTLLYFRKLEGQDRDLSLKQLITKCPFIENFVYLGRSVDNG